MSNPDDLTPESPAAEGLVEPELRTTEIEGARLLANEVRERLRADGFTDAEIDAWARTYYTEAAGGTDEGDADGLVRFVQAEQAAGHRPR